MAAGHVELLALAPKLAFCDCWNEHLRGFKLLPQRIDFWWSLYLEWLYDQ